MKPDVLYSIRFPNRIERKVGVCCCTENNELGIRFSVADGGAWIPLYALNCKDIQELEPGKVK